MMAGNNPKIFKALTLNLFLTAFYKKDKMMNRQITQWHNPKDCSAACARLENVMNQLKTLARSMEDEEDGYSQRKMENANIPSLKDVELPCQPMPAHYRYPETPPPPTPCCGKRNGLQDYCGVMSPECYMNPKAIVNKSYGMGEQLKYPYERDTNMLRCNGNYGGAPGTEGAMTACHGKECTNEFYLIPAEPHR